jgi:hypothetical protein
MTPMHLISCGGGVQSTTVCLLAARNLITPMPVAAIFADTGDEPESVYRHVDWLEKQLPFPLYRVKRPGKTLSETALTIYTNDDGKDISRTLIPTYTQDVDGSAGKIRHRSCTKDFKIDVIMRKARQLANVKRGETEVRVVQWVGISLDEVQRMKPSRDPWAQVRWPLIELNMTRHDCLRWMEANGYPKPPRSACVYCPFHSDHEWRRLKTEEPQEFRRAVEFEKKLQESKAMTDNFRSRPFLHKSLVPLGEVDFSTPEDNGQIPLWSSFTEECEGMCGV